jgi:hypothetical protein
MRRSLLKALLLPLALLASAGINQAMAATCATSYTMTAVTAAGFSCTLGALTFSNFEDIYTGTGASTPDPTANITVSFAEAMSGADPFGTAATVISPIYSVITGYTGGNSTGEFQSETGVVQYLVTDGAAGTAITEVDAAIDGLADNTATGSLNKNVCANGQFEESGAPAAPNGVCSSGSELTAASVLSVSNPAGTEADGTPDWVGPFSLSTLGVYDAWALSGGTTTPAAIANLASVENDFIETTALSITPEPSAFVLLGSALVGLGVIRRRRKLA